MEKLAEKALKIHEVEKSTLSKIEGLMKDAKVDPKNITPHFVMEFARDRGIDLTQEEAKSIAKAPGMF